MNFKHAASALALTALVASSSRSAAAADALKVAVVDTQRAVADTEDGLRARATMKKLFESKQQELGRKEQDLLKQRDDLEKQMRVMSKEAFQKREEDFRRQTIELQAMLETYNKEIFKKQKELTDPIVERVMGNIKRLASQEGYDLIVDRAGAPYFRSDLDLTDKVIRLSNGGSAGGKDKDKEDKTKGGDKPKAP